MYNKEVTQEWRRKHRKQHLTISREGTARYRYGLTHAQAEELRSRQCEICGDLAKKMCIDHKLPGSFRGVLCQSCNVNLGWFERRKEIILKYLQKDKVDYASGIASSKDGHGNSRTSSIQIEQEKQGAFENESPAIA
jgi:hypothetical protein